MADEAAQGRKHELSEQAMRKYGIERVPVDYFHIHGYRYTDLQDAVAQAIRGQPVKGRV